MTPGHRVPSPMDEKPIFPTLGDKFDRFYYGQVHSSPYKLPLVTISIGEDKYEIPWSYLEKYHKLDRLNCSGSLELPVSPDIGHTIVHFLYTGKWQTIDSRPPRNKTYMEREYQRCVQVYHASIKYGLDELKTMAEQYIAHFGKEYSAIEVLRLTSEAFSEFPADEFWLPKYVANALQEMVIGVKSKVKISDNSTLNSPSSLAIMAAVIEVQYSRILELENTRGPYHQRPGAQMHGFGAGYYPNSRHLMHTMYPMPARATSPGSAVDTALPDVRRHHRPASPSSYEYSSYAGTHSIAGRVPPTPDEDTAEETLVHPPEHPAGDPTDASDVFPDCDSDEGSEKPTPVKDCLSAVVTDDGSTEVLAYGEAVVEHVEASVYEESIAGDSVTGESFTEGFAGKEPVEVIVYEESMLDEPVVEEPTEEASAKEETAVEEANPWKAWKPQYIKWETVAEKSANGQLAVEDADLGKQGTPILKESTREEPTVEGPVSEGPVTETVVTETDQTQPLLPNSYLYEEWKTLSSATRRKRTRKLKRKGLPIPDQNGVISITLA